MTIHCDKVTASVVAASYYSFYNIMLVYTVSDFSMTAKCIITFAANLLGTFVVKLVEEKLQKDKLWVYHATCKENSKNIQALDLALKNLNIKRVYTEVVKNELYTMQIFSNNKDESKLIQEVLKHYNIRYHVYETIDT